MVVLCAVLGTIIYRLSLVSVIYGGGGSFLKKHAKIVTSVSAALINLVIIMCLTRVSILFQLINVLVARPQNIDLEDTFGCFRVRYQMGPVQFLPTWSIRSNVLSISTENYLNKNKIFLLTCET